MTPSKTVQQLNSDHLPIIVNENIYGKKTKQGQIYKHMYKTDCNEFKIHINNTLKINHKFNNFQVIETEINKFEEATRKARKKIL